ncbi:DUF1847 domain-containing protein [Chloroflexota bacterium]
MKSNAAQCAKCPVKRCRTLDEDTKLPDFCPTQNYPVLIKESVETNKTDPEVRKINLAWAELSKKVSQNKYSWTRLDEVMEYAKIRGVKKIGVATCIGLLSEAKQLTNILERHGFDVVSVSCLAGEVTPEDVDIVRKGIFCNPIVQAGVLNQERTELNIMLGLCIGHDILFQRYSEADATTLVVKDKALGHNPVAALLLSDSYYHNRF